MELVSAFITYIKQKKLLKKGDSLLLGVSGGPDSLTMLDLFYRIKDRLKLNLVVFHLNHQFRPEAAEEAEFVARIAREYQLKAIIEKYDVPGYIETKGLSPEEAARDIRFKLLFKWVNKLQIDRIALAHNQDDLVETIFLNLIRGTGLNGLTGIDPLTDYDRIKIIHPLLTISRDRIEKYCKSRGLNPRQDPTNKENIYSRNKIRNKVIPYLEKEFNPALKEVIARMSENIREEEYFLADLAKDSFNQVLLEKTPRKVVLDLISLHKKNKVIRRRVYTMAVKDLKGDQIDLYSYHYQAIDDLLIEGRTGKLITLKNNLIVKRSYHKLIFQFEELEKERETTDYEFKLTVPGEITLPDQRMIRTKLLLHPDNGMDLASSRYICFCDADKVRLPLTIRNRRPGDRFNPLGMTGVKKLKDFFIDNKIPAQKRDHIPLILDNRGIIIWIAGLRMNDKVKVTSKTDKIIKIELEGVQV